MANDPEGMRAAPHLNQISRDLREMADCPNGISVSCGGKVTDRAAGG